MLWCYETCKPQILNVVHCISHLRKVKATFLNQGVDYAVHDRYQSQDQDGVENLLKKYYCIVSILLNNMYYVILSQYDEAALTYLHLIGLYNKFPLQT